MIQRTKKLIAIPVAISLVALLISSGYSPTSHIRERQEASRLVATIKTIEPWGSVAYYDAERCRRLVEVAAMANSAPSNIVVRALRECCEASVPGPTMRESTRAFLLLRVMFDLPEKANASNTFTSRAWMLMSASSERLDANADGTVDLGWPLVWKNGQLIEVRDGAGYKGPPYSPVQEYRYLLSTYPKRKFAKNQ